MAVGKEKGIVLRNQILVVFQERGSYQFCQNAPKWSGNMDQLSTEIFNQGCLGTVIGPKAQLKCLRMDRVVRKWRRKY